MIDYESILYTKMAKKLRSEFNPISVYGEVVKAPATFPSVMIEEKHNSSFSQTADSGSTENHALTMYEVNIYSNKTSGKKHECKTILAIIDEEFIGLGFERVIAQPIDNLEDATIYRIVARYQAVLSTDGIVYRR